MADEVIAIEDLKRELGIKNTIIDVQETIKNFIQKNRIERISRIRDLEVDKLCQMLFFGIRHTALLNKKKYSEYNYMNIHKTTYNDLRISAILEYTLINLALRLSISSKSREELKDIVTGLIKSELQKIIATEKEQNV